MNVSKIRNSICIDWPSNYLSKSLAFLIMEWRETLSQMSLTIEISDIQVKCLHHLLNYDKCNKDRLDGLKCHPKDISPAHHYPKGH